MKEKILVSSVLNGKELLCSLALRGKSFFAFRVLTPARLAETALIRCGKVPPGKRMRAQEQQFVTGELMRRVGYFSGVFSFRDAMDLADTLNAMRMRFVSEEAEGLRKTLPSGEFTDKNGALLEMYGLYTAWLAENDRYDDVCLIRYAAEQAAEMDAELITLEEFALSPLEAALVSRLSGGKARMLSLQEAYGASLRLDSLTRAYGAVNEADRMIRDIRGSGIPLDRCTVAVTEPAVYAQLFYDLYMEKGIPVAFGCGIPVSNTRPAGLLDLWGKWNGTGFHGADALGDMLYSDTFDRSRLTKELNQNQTEEEGEVHLPDLVPLAGRMRLGTDEQVNAARIDAWEKTLSESAEERKQVKALRLLGRELALPCDDFLKKYTCIREYPAGKDLDTKARAAILKVLGSAERYPGLMATEDMIPLALGQTVCMESAQEGKLFVTSVTGALSVQREHLFILGLSADKFPGKPRENALMLDSDWELLPCPETAPTSGNRVRENRDRLELLIRLAASLNIGVHAYWPDYDPAQMKELIPSSAVYRLLDACPDVKEEKEGFFPAVYSDSYAAGRLYLEGGRITPEKGSPPEEKREKAGRKAKREWSPTAIDTWFGCKRRFQYRYLLGLDAAEPDDPMVIAPANAVGNMAHHLMEILAADKPDAAEFHDMASAMFDDFLTARPPMDEAAAEREKDRFVQMMDAAWKQDPKHGGLSEREIHSRLRCGLLLKGRPDRVEDAGDGGYIVVDFKTGSTPEHVPDDPQTCRQVLIYAWMLQQEGKRIVSCEYRYLRLSRTVKCGTGPEIMGKLEEDLERFYNGLEAGDFAAEDGYGNPLKKNGCRYCPYAGICEMDKKREEAPV